MSRLVQIVLLDANERETGRFDRATDRHYRVNDLVEHPADRDLWLVSAVEPAEAPYAEIVTCLYVGRDADPPRFVRTS
jgi:hypothetical protein